MKKILFLPPLTAIFIFTSIIIILKLYLNSFSEAVLGAYVYPGMTVEKTALETDSIMLFNIDSGDGLKVDTAKIKLSLPDSLQSRTMGLQIIFDRARKDIRTEWGPLSLQGSGKMSSDKEGMLLKAGVSGQSSFTEFTGQMTTRILPQGSWKSRLDVMEGRLVTDDYFAWDVAGWMTFADSSVTAARVTSKMLEVGGLRLQDLVVTFQDERIAVSGTGVRRRFVFDRAPDGKASCNGLPFTAPVPDEQAPVLAAVVVCAIQ